MNSPLYYSMVILVGLVFAVSIPVLWALRSKRLACEHQVLASLAKVSTAGETAWPLLIVLLDTADRTLAPYNEYASVHKLDVVYLYAAPKWMAEMKSRAWGVELIAVDEGIVRLFAPRKLFLLDRRVKNVSLKKLSVV